MANAPAAWSWGRPPRRPAPTATRPATCLNRARAVPIARLAASVSKIASIHPTHSRTAAPTRAFRCSDGSEQPVACGRAGVGAPVVPWRAPRIARLRASPTIGGKGTADADHGRVEPVLVAAPALTGVGLPDENRRGAASSARALRSAKGESSVVAKRACRSLCRLSSMVVTLLCVTTGDRPRAAPPGAAANLGVWLISGVTSSGRPLLSEPPGANLFPVRAALAQRHQPRLPGTTNDKPPHHGDPGDSGGWATETPARHRRLPAHPH